MIKLNKTIISVLVYADTIKASLYFQLKWYFSNYKFKCTILRKTIEGYLDSVPSLTSNTILDWFPSLIKLHFRYAYKDWYCTFKDR